jgi:hypothetical protein
MMENGKTASLTATVLKFGQMEESMKENGEMLSQLV